MQGLNKVMLIGHLGKDPVFATLEKGINLSKCSLATSESYRDKNGTRHTHTEWHTLILWQGLADYAHKYLKKGNLVYVEGKIKTRSYEDKDKQKRYITEVIVERINLLHSTTPKETEANPHSVETETNPHYSIEQDTHLPF